MTSRIALFMKQLIRGKTHTALVQTQREEITSKHDIFADVVVNKHIHSK